MRFASGVPNLMAFVILAILSLFFIIGMRNKGCPFRYSSGVSGPQSLSFWTARGSDSSRPAPWSPVSGESDDVLY